jgi:RNA polymerase sigma factor (sigma-70 family)
MKLRPAPGAGQVMTMKQVRSSGQRKISLPAPQFSGLPNVYPGMSSLTALQADIPAQNRDLTAVIARERSRLGSFIRRRVADPGEAEDILQEVLFELVESTRLLRPIEQVGAWLFRVARNRIIDRFRAARAAPWAQPVTAEGEDDGATLEDLLPAADGGPEARYARRVLLEEIEAALEELPAGQREVFVAHELEGRSFRDLAEESGLNINTLLARKRYAVRHLRARLQRIHDELQVLD